MQGTNLFFLDNYRLLCYLICLLYGLTDQNVRIAATKNSQRRLNICLTKGSKIQKRLDSMVQALRIYFGIWVESS